jgi:hypothetical protein
MPLTTDILEITFPPTGIDRATGTGDFPGTPNDPNDIVEAPEGPFFEEDPGSPEIERAEQATFTHTFYCDETTGNDILTSYGRGILFQDTVGNITKLLSSKINHMRGGYCKLVMVSEGVNFDNPPDEFELDIIDINPNIEKHPRYSALTYKDRYIVRNANISDNVDLAQQYKNAINQIPAGQISRKNQAQELLFKLHKGEDSFYLPGFKISWSSYYWLPQLLNPGGYIEDPIDDGGLPYFFYSTDGLPGGDSIFADCVNINPTIYKTPDGADSGISWFRLADTQHYNRTWFKLTRSWQGGPIGHWDNELYNKTPQAYQTSEDAGGL